MSLVTFLPKELREELMLYCFEITCVLDEIPPFQIPHGVRRKSEDTIVNLAVREGCLSLLKWAINKKYPCRSDVSHIAARQGHLHILQYIRTVKEFPWKEWTHFSCFFAAQGGHLEILQWLHDQECPWDKKTCQIAAQEGHLPILKWLLKEGCPWNKIDCIEAAIEYNQLVILQWIRGSYCPWPFTFVLKYAKQLQKYDIVKWIEGEDITDC